MSRWFSTLGVRITFEGAIGALLLASLSLSACGSGVAPPQVETRPPERDTRYLSSPLQGYPLTVDSELSAAVRQAHEDLLAGESPELITERALQILEIDAGFHPATVLLAQVDALATNDLRVLERLDPVADELPEYLACQLLRGRAAERTGDIIKAYDAFRRIAGRSELASRRSEDLLPRALEVTSNRLEEALDRGRIEDAEAQLEQLLEWLGPDPRTQYAALQIAVAKGDLEQELTYVRQLAASGGERWARERWAQLEVEIGDVRAGLETLQQLVAEFPDDMALTDQLHYAKFLWRVQLLPVHVQELRRKPELDRADFATLLYWLIPQVRLSRLDKPPIATDILDHPRREEILPVTDLRLMDVNRSLHRFDPEIPVTRQMAFVAMLRLLEISGRQFSCLSGGELAAVRRTTSMVCAKAAQCRYIPEIADCLPAAAISGSEAMELFRFQIDLMGSNGS